MVSALDSELSSPGSNHGQGNWGNCVVFLDKTLFIVPLSTQVCKWVLASLLLWGNPAID